MKIQQSGICTHVSGVEGDNPIHSSFAGKKVEQG
jgi:hypothetical protein